MSEDLSFWLNPTSFEISEGEWGKGNWEDSRKEISLIVISAEQKLIHFCRFPFAITSDDNFFCYYFKWQIVAHILRTATHFDLKDYVFGILDIAGKNLILLNNRNLWIL